jgi:hypothetical protein
LALPISALNHKPTDFIREVSPEAITFYIDDMSGLYLPDEFKQEYWAQLNVKNGKLEERLHGKFGRFVIGHIENDGKYKEKDVMLMGTTIGLSTSSRNGELEYLRHRNLYETVIKLIEEQGMLSDLMKVDPADFGSTSIITTARGSAESIYIGGSSMDFGRAAAEGRQQTCELFQKLLGDTIKVVNVEPELMSTQQLITVKT